MNFYKHYDFCVAHPIRSFGYKLVICFLAVHLGRCFHVPRPLYIAIAVIAYYGLTDGLSDAANC
jgi:hypothetical protein